MRIASVPLPSPGAYGVGDRIARAIVHGILARRCGEHLIVSEDEGHAAEARPDVVSVAVHQPAFYRQLLRYGSIGLARSYVAGWWDSDDLVGVIRQATRALPRPGSIVDRSTRPISLLWSARSVVSVDDQARDRVDIRTHYDLGDDFFALFLDPTLTYSCGLFEGPDVSLEEAQLAKLDHICRMLDLGPGDEVLEIGSGWGSFALHAATNYDCRITTTTISDRQYALTSKRVKERGLGSQVTVLNEDYRDVKGTFDKLVSIEMIEAIGWRQFDRFFATCSESLRANGRMALQAIVIDDRLYERAKHVDDFVKAMVFPGSTIPSVASIETAVRQSSDLSVVKCSDIGSNYVETLARWRHAFRSNRSEAAKLGFDRDFLRLWDLYLAYCQAGFAEGRISDVQMLLAKPGTTEPARARI